VRLGIATGLAVVGDLIGEGAAQERGVVGETPNLAARLLIVSPFIFASKLASPPGCPCSVTASLYPLPGPRSNRRVAKAATDH
jgi:class 3 adenylate cyclase